MVTKFDNLKSWNVEKGANFENCPNFVTIFCRVLKMKIIFFDISRNPPPIAVRSSLTNQCYQKKWCFCIFSTTTNRDIHPGDSWPYIFFLFLLNLLSQPPLSKKYNDGNVMLDSSNIVSLITEHNTKTWLFLIIFVLFKIKKI